MRSGGADSAIEFCTVAEIATRSHTLAAIMKSPSVLRTFARCGAVLLFCRFSLVPSAQTPPDEILLKDYKPRSIFKIPETRVEKARYVVIDVHSHDYAPTDADVDRWVRTMDEVGLEKTIILSGSTRAKFDDTVAKYGKHPKRFAVWCGIDYSGFNQTGLSLLFLKVLLAHARLGPARERPEKDL